MRPPPKKSPPTYKKTKETKDSYAKCETVIFAKINSATLPRQVPPKTSVNLAVPNLLAPLCFAAGGQPGRSYFNQFFCYSEVILTSSANALSAFNGILLYGSVRRRQERGGRRDADQRVDARRIAKRNSGLQVNLRRKIL